MSNIPILFTTASCPACMEQEQILRNSQKKLKIMKINTDAIPPGMFDYVTFTPTWAIPKGNGKFTIYTGLIRNLELLHKVCKIKRKVCKIKRKTRKVCKKKSRFGQVKLMDGINNLQALGKTFLGGGSFNVPKTYMQEVQSVWGDNDDVLNAGIGGSRSLGPGKIAEVLSNNYVNNIRMAHPSDQLGTYLYLNRACNTSKGSSGNLLKSYGEIYDSENPQIVDNTTGFGNRRNRFGEYGPAYGNQYLINKDTGNQLYSGARQGESSRPLGLNNFTFIGQAKDYKPFKR